MTKRRTHKDGGKLPDPGCARSGFLPFPLDPPRVIFSPADVHQAETGVWRQVMSLRDSR